MAAGEFSRLLMSHWRELHEKLRSHDEEIVVDGRSLSLAAVVASARYGHDVIISPETLEIVGRCTDRMYGQLQHGNGIAGKHTSFGSSATVQTTAIEQIQRSMIRDLHYGVLAGETDYDISHATRTFSSAIPLSDPVESSSMPEPWVKAAILIRANSLAYATSGVRPVLLQRLLQLLNLDITPRIPLRGSISSGDYTPLSYIGGVLQGKPAVQAWIGDRIQGGRKLVPGDEALNYAEIEPLDLRAKEGLAIMVGTASSAAVASLALHETMCLAATSQVLTAMAAEALCNSEVSLLDIFSDIKPHPGQTECATNIRNFLIDSKLTTKDPGAEDFMIRQDRYAVRTAPQWIGPVLEDLLLAHSQISVEINSITDAPLIEQSTGKMLHGGNFQAKSVTSAVEKVRQGCQSLGQMLFAQCTELINPASNKGLAPNLVVDEPSQSGMWKGTDMLIAALQSELSFLANPVGSHVQFAEMGIQSINSLALVSGRYTLTAVDVLTQLAAAHLVALCQALDLRALHIQFLYALAPKFKFLTRRCLSECIEQITPSSEGGGAEIAYDLWVNLSEQINRTTQLDTAFRFSHAMDFLQSRLLRELPPTQQSLEAVQQWHADCVHEAIQTHQAIRTRYLTNPDATPVLGKASRRMYTYVRKKLEVPFFGDDYLRVAEWDDGTSHTSRFKYRSMGAMISAVYEAMRNGALYAEVVQCFEDV